jgi:pimeloyl-ACP methyl ester carboxylesterase
MVYENKCSFYIERLTISSLLLFIIFCLAANLMSCSEKSPDTHSISVVGTALSSDGVKINYQVIGDGQPALIFVHGWSCDLSYWDAQIKYFSPKYQVITLDLAGHGKSGRERDNYSVTAFAEDVVGVIEKLELDKIVLIGHSMGGAIIIETARRIPERVLGLVGADTFQDIEASYSQEEIDQFIAPFKENFKETTSEFVLNMFPLNADSTLVRNVINDIAVAPKEIAISSLANFFSYKPLAALQEIEIPVQLIICDKYPVNIEAAKRHVHNFEVSTIPGVGHFIMLEDPETFNQILDGTIIKFTGKTS